MVSYPLTTTFVQPCEPLDLIVRVLRRLDDHSVTHVAAENDCSPAHLYDSSGAPAPRSDPVGRGPSPTNGSAVDFTPACPIWSASSPRLTPASPR